MFIITKMGSRERPPLRSPASFPRTSGAGVNFGLDLSIIAIHTFVIPTTIAVISAAAKFLVECALGNRLVAFCWGGVFVVVFTGGIPSIIFSLAVVIIAIGILSDAIMIAVFVSVSVVSSVSSITSLSSGVVTASTADRTTAP